MGKEEKALRFRRETSDNANDSQFGGSKPSGSDNIRDQWSMNHNGAHRQQYNPQHYKRPSVSVNSNKENVSDGPAAKRAAHTQAKRQEKRPIPANKVYAIEDVGQVQEAEILNYFGYTAEEVLGTGKYCRVRLATDRRNPFKYDVNGNTVPARVAMKIIDSSKISREFNQKFLPRELNIWRRLDHPHLVRMLGQFQYGCVFVMAMEHVGGGDLLSFVQGVGPITEFTARHWMWQLLQAVHYMHSLAVSHRDLKLENILLDDARQLKICDFGFSRQITDQYELSQTYCGSKAYSCPEILAGVPYDVFKADVWALGVIWFILLTNKMPYNEHVHHNSVIIEAQEKRSYTYSRKLDISDSCKQLVDTMMTFSQDERPSCAQVLQAPYWSETVLSTSGHANTSAPAAVYRDANIG